MNAQQPLNYLLHTATRADRLAVAVTRLGLITVLLWIGGLKAFQYEAQSIVPFVAHSPLMRFFYADPAHYEKHMNREGDSVPANIAWHEHNNTLRFSYGLGSVIVAYGLLLCLHPWFPKLAALGGSSSF